MSPRSTRGFCFSQGRPPVIPKTGTKAYDEYQEGRRRRVSANAQSVPNLYRSIFGEDMAEVTAEGGVKEEVEEGGGEMEPRNLAL